ncbi:MAG TPA: hypothetical protein VKY74_23975 [Chloroflexia bacterium]|nr:hypothetical protein [Chloroflexia bacterium]
MAGYGSQIDFGPDLNMLAASSAGWPLPAAPEDASDDWSGVVGDCHALRPAGAGAGQGPLPADEDDWGYGAEAM